MGMKIDHCTTCLQRCGVCCQQTGLIIWAQLDGLDLWSISSGTIQLAQANHLYSCLCCLVLLMRSCLLYAASQQVFIEWPWRQQQLSVQSGGGEYRESLAVGGVVPNTSLLRRLAPTRGLELMMSCGVTGFRFILAPLSLKLEGLLKYLWLDSLGWQKRGEQSKIKSEECDRDYVKVIPTPRRGAKLIMMLLTEQLAQIS